MTDIFSKKTRSIIMSKIRSKNTWPEMQIRKALHRSGFRYTLHDKKLPGKPDIVLPRYKTAIQIRGCFWHSHGCSLSSQPKTNKRYWLPKLEATRQRDCRNDKRLRRTGCSLLVIWECMLKKKNGIEKNVKRIIMHLKKCKT